MMSGGMVFHSPSFRYCHWSERSSPLFAFRSSWHNATVLLAGKHPTIVQFGLRGYMDQLRQVGRALAKMPDIIRALLPWDVGQSQWVKKPAFDLSVSFRHRNVLNIRQNSLV